MKFLSVHLFVWHLLQFGSGTHQRSNFILFFTPGVDGTSCGILSFPTRDQAYTHSSESWIRTTALSENSHFLPSFHQMNVLLKFPYQVHWTWLTTWGTWCRGWWEKTAGGRNKAGVPMELIRKPPHRNCNGRISKTKRTSWDPLSCYWDLLILLDSWKMTSNLSV